MQSSLLSFYFDSDYTISSFVDRDMLMRFHWGLGAGHVYAHRQSCTNVGVIWGDTNQRFRSGDIHSERLESSMPMATQQDLCEPNGDVDAGPGSGTDGSGSESDDEDSDYRSSNGDDDQSSDEDEDEYWLDVDGQVDSDDDLYEG